MFHTLTFKKMNVILQIEQINKSCFPGLFGRWTAAFPGTGWACGAAGLPARRSAGTDTAALRPYCCSAPPQSTGDRDKAAARRRSRSAVPCLDCGTRRTQRCSPAKTSTRSGCSTPANRCRYPAAATAAAGSAGPRRRCRGLFRCSGKWAGLLHWRNNLPRWGRANAGGTPPHCCGRSPFRCIRRRAYRNPAPSGSPPAPEAGKTAPSTRALFFPKCQKFRAFAFPFCFSAAAKAAKIGQPTTSPTPFST